MTAVFVFTHLIMILCIFSLIKPNLFMGEPMITREIAEEEHLAGGVVSTTEPALFI
jgi:hypothetical protein